MGRMLIAVAALFALTPTAIAKRPAVISPPPIIVQTPPPIQLNERYGDWNVVRFGDGFLARTSNESGSVLGVLCDKICTILFNPQIDCENKSKYSALLSTPAGAAALSLVCVRTKEYAIFGARLEKELLDAMEVGGQAGIAFPMQSGTFKVVRFSLTGALTASKRAYRLAHPNGDEPDAVQGLRDQTL